MVNRQSLLSEVACPKRVTQKIPIEPAILPNEEMMAKAMISDLEYLIHVAMDQAITIFPSACLVDVAHLLVLSSKHSVLMDE